MNHHPDSSRLASRKSKVYGDTQNMCVTDDPGRVEGDLNIDGWSRVEGDLNIDGWKET